MKKFKQTLLWEISGAQFPGKSYLFGSMHVRDQRAFRRLEPIYAAIGACEAFAAEFNLDDAIGGESLETFALPEGQSLDQLMPLRKYTKLRRLLHKAMGIELDFFRYSQPILISNLIEERVMESEMPFALDQHLWQYALGHHKKMRGIETFQEQLEILQKIPLEQQISALLATGQQVSRHRRNLLKMAKWYEQGDIHQLYQASRRGAHGLRRLLLYDRNERMARRIAWMAREETTFCAVGAAHLAGMKGVLRLLKQMSVKVNPVPFEEE